MGAVNKVILIGNLGADPESRTTASGMVVTTLRIATNEKKKNGDEWVDHTEWHRVVCFGKVAENAARYLAKGRQVYIEGAIRSRKWTDNEGVERYMTEIAAHGVVFLGGGTGERSGGGSNDRSGGGRSEDTSSTGGGGLPPDDDIPFAVSLDEQDPCTIVGIGRRGWMP